MASAPLQDLTNALYGKYNIGNLTALGLQTNLIANCSTVATGSLLWVNEDCVVLINNTGTTLTTGQIVRIGVSNVSDGCILATTSTDDYYCGVVYRGGVYQQPVVVAIQGEYPVLMINGTGETPIKTGNLIVVSSTPGKGVMTGGTIGTTNCIGVCAQTSVMPADFLVKCMIQNFQSI